MPSVNEIVPSPLISPPVRTTHALIVDDHGLFRKGLRELIESEAGMVVCGEAFNEEEGFEKFLSTTVDFVTVDVSLASGHGLNLVSRIKKERATTAVLVISMYEESVFAERAVAAGASGYVSKQASNTEIVTAIRAVRSGQIYLRPDIMQRLLRRRVGGDNSKAASPNELLSDRELVILSLIGEGKSTQHIATELHLAISTVETYRERIKTKLGLSSAAELIRHAVLWLMQNA